MKVTFEKDNKRIEIQRVDRSLAYNAEKGFALHLDYYDGVDEKPHYMWIEKESDLKALRDMLDEYINLIEKK